METALNSEAQYEQFVALMKTYPHEIEGLRVRLVEGRFDGRYYWHEQLECGCILGTIAHLRGVSEDDILFYEDSTISHIERLALEIEHGDTPATNPVSALLVAWIDSLPAVDAKGGK